MNGLIGTITFHWATNYGAVLQAYALQRYLISIGTHTEIINYVPIRIKLLQFYSRIRSKSFGEFIKEYQIDKFVKKEMILSKKKYSSNKDLKKAKNSYSAVICGSDQVWNESFTLGAENKTTLSYFLDFCDVNTKKIAYAVSFGTTKVSNEYINATQCYAREFHAISVRETTGLDILEQLGCTGQVVCDPTLLLEKKDYIRLLHDKSYSSSRVFSYILHGDNNALRVADVVKEKYEESYSCNNIGIYEWLFCINSAEMVVTNSFHGIMLSLILNTPFVAVLIKGSGMNDRINTVLKFVGLEDRIIEGYNTKKIDSIISSGIDWDIVNGRR